MEPPQFLIQSMSRTKEVQERKTKSIQLTVKTKTTKLQCPDIADTETIIITLRVPIWWRRLRAESSRVQPLVSGPVWEGGKPCCADPITNLFIDNSFSSNFIWVVKLNIKSGIKL